MFEVFTSEVVMFEAIATILLVDILLLAILILVDGFDELYTHKAVSLIFILLSAFVGAVLRIFYDNYPPIGVLYVLAGVAIMSALISLHGIITVFALIWRERRSIDFVDRCEDSSDDDSYWL